MRPSENMHAVIARKRYSTKTANLLAGDDYWDGHNFERHGHNTFLYRTPKGNFFTVHLTQWQGERDAIEVISLDDAIRLYEGLLSEHEVDYEEAFPGIEIQDA